MSALVPFDFDGQAVRVVTDEHGEPWFIAADVARVLGYSESAAMTRTLDDDEKGLRSVQTPGGEQQMVVVSESGLFSAILRSRIPAAKDFRRWLTHTVLPEIRKTGSFNAQTALPTVVDAGMLRQIAAAMEAKDARIAELEPAAAVAEAISAAAGDMSVREAAQTLARDHGIDTGQKRLFEKLRSLRWIDSQGRAYQAQLETGRLSVRTTTYDHPHTGEPMLSTQLRVTGKGLKWLHEHWFDAPSGLRALPGGAS